MYSEPLPKAPGDDFPMEPDGGCNGSGNQPEEARSEDEHDHTDHDPPHEEKRRESVIRLPGSTSFTCGALVLGLAVAILVSASRSSARGHYRYSRMLASTMMHGSTMHCPYSF